MTMTAAEEAAELQQALSLLSPQEREAMMAGDGDENADELKIINELQDNGDTETRTITKDDLPEPTDSTGKGNDLANEDEDGDDAGAADATAQAQAAVDADKAAQDAAAAAAQANEQTQVQDDAGPVMEPVLNYVVPPVENYEEKIAAIAAERAKAMKDLLAGELTDEEYAAIDTRTMADHTALSSAQNRHQISVEMREAQVKAWCDKQIADVKSEAKAAGLDYDADPKLHKAWDRWVKNLADDPENETKPYGWFLKEAHRLTALQYNRPDVVQRQPNTAAPKQEAAAQPQAKPAQRQPRAPDLSQIPPTLGKAPAAAIESEGDVGEFAYIDKLVGIERERALARLTPDQEERYLAS